MSLMTITQNVTLVNVTNESQPTFLSWRTFCDLH